MSVIQPRTATVDIYQGDYLDRIRHIERKHEAAVKVEGGITRTADEIPESHALYEEHQALVAEAEETKLVITVGALGRKGWRALVKEHPPRKAGEGVTEAEADSDEGMGVNEETFKDALVPLSVVSPELDQEDFDQISDGDYDRIYLTAFALNRSPAASPKVMESPASRESRMNDES